MSWEEELFWAAMLSDGQTFYEESPTSWLGLRQHCIDNGLYIHHLRLEFRSHIEHIESAEGYMIWKGVGLLLGSERSNAQYIIGAVHGSKVNVYKYLVPELLVVDKDVRPLDSCPTSSHLIRARKI